MSFAQESASIGLTSNVEQIDEIMLSVVLYDLRLASDLIVSTDIPVILDRFS